MCVQRTRAGPASAFIGSPLKGSCRATLGNRGGTCLHRHVDDACMDHRIVVDSELATGRGERSRRWHRVEKKRRIIEERLATGASESALAWTIHLDQGG